MVRKSSTLKRRIVQGRMALPGVRVKLMNKQMVLNGRMHRIKTVSSMMKWVLLIIT